MASPFTGFDARGQIDDRQTQLFYDTSLRKRYPIDDPMMKIIGAYDPNSDEPGIPDAIMINVNANGNAATTLSLREDFVGAGAVGSTAPSGVSVEVPVFRHLDLFADNVFHVTEYNAPKWGLEGVTDAQWKCQSENELALSKWHKEKEGIYRRQAVIEGYSGNINATGGGTRLRINRNVIVGNTSTGAAFVTYNDTQATYITSINTAWTSGTVKKVLDLSYLNQLHFLITSSATVLEPVTIGGQQRYVMLVSAYQASVLSDPTNAAAFAAFMKGSPEVLSIWKTGFVMEYKSIIIIQDQRCARVTIGAGAFTPSYKNPGRGTDGRAVTGATVADAALILGKGALYRYNMVPLHWGTNEDQANFGKTPKLAAIATYGYIGGEFFDSAGLWKVNDSSAVVLLGSV